MEYDITLQEAFEKAAKEHPQISINPDVMGGAPCIKGTRIPTYCMISVLMHNKVIKEIINQYPQLSIEQAAAALSFIYDVIANQTYNSLEGGVSEKNKM